MTNKECPTCDGEGSYYADDGLFTLTGRHECPDCFGTGKVQEASNTKCPECDGTGYYKPYGTEEKSWKWQTCSECFGTGTGKRPLQEPQNQEKCPQCGNTLNSIHGNEWWCENCDYEGCPLHPTEPHLPCNSKRQVQEAEKPNRLCVCGHLEHNHRTSDADKCLHVGCQCQDFKTPSESPREQEKPHCNLCPHWNPHCATCRLVAHGEALPNGDSIPSAERTDDRVETGALTATADDVRRFRQKYEIQPDGCWYWTAFIDNHGYGMFRGSRLTRTMSKAHRYSYELWTREPIDPALVIDHLCRVRHCVNPEHLEPVPPKVNSERGDHKRVLKTHCGKGHPFTGENVIYLKRGGRRCRVCHLAYGKKWRINHAA